MTSSSASESHAVAAEEAHTAPKAAGTSRLRKRLKVMLITFAVVLALWGTLFLLTENESTAPFVYAIF